MIRAREMLDVPLPDHVEAWLEECCARPSVRAELDVVAAL